MSRWDRVIERWVNEPFYRRALYPMALILTEMAMDDEEDFPEEPPILFDFRKKAQ